MIDLLLGFIISAVCLFLDMIFLSCFFPSRAEKKQVGIGVLSGLILIPCMSYFLCSVPMIKMMVTLVMLIILTKLMFDMSIKESIIANSLFLAIYAGCELITFFLIQRVMVISRLETLTNATGAFLVDMLSELIVLIAIITISAITKMTNLSRMDFKGWSVFSLFPIFSVVVELLLIINYDASNSEGLSGTMMFTGTGLLILNVVLIYLLSNVINRELEISKNKELIDKADHVYHMYEVLVKEREIQKSQAHDYLNHLNTIKALAISGDYESQTKYLSELIDKSTSTHDLYDTGHPIVNAILNQKFTDADENDALLIVLSDDLSSVNVNESDLVTILSNVIDNAIEAIKSCDEKKIILKMRIHNGSLYIDSTNNYSSNIDYDHYRTTKPDKQNHGYGLINIKRAVMNNSGHCFIETDSDMFHITIEIPLE